jgi:hypothetical protein
MLVHKLMKFLQKPKVRESALIIGLNLAMTVVKTMAHSKAYEHEGFSKDDRHLLNVQEGVRQTISTGLWLTSLVASWALVERIFPNRGPFAKLLMTNLVSSLPDALVRPFLTAKVSKVYLQKTWSQPALKPQAPETAILHQPSPINFYTPIPSSSQHVTPSFSASYRQVVPSPYTVASLRAFY